MAFAADLQQVLQALNVTSPAGTAEQFLAAGADCWDDVAAQTPESIADWVFPPIKRHRLLQAAERLATEAATGASARVAGALTPRAGSALGSGSGPLERCPSGFLPSDLPDPSDPLDLSGSPSGFLPFFSVLIFRCEVPDTT
eukprot:NODE_1787_length_1301_cov_16.403355_g1481_i0.p2 GENE.NODE_1787_length_1301_cov_16.403355_g1481_i0~~NODE_1787_length_1301_cov_16.403355_g1481_i0.p2  ORF type:complete len:142 (+),score=11.53 NODE_1787_length_1301_cov_16.403355_g1481_i0:696-1121(+)